MVDHIPGKDGAGEGAEDLELDPNAPLEGEMNDQGGDPLDDIKDEKARDEAKKHRAIGRRLGKDGKTIDAPVPKPKPVENNGSKPFTHADFERANEKKATLTITSDPEIKAHWDKILPYFHSRRGKETAEDIVEDFNDAITLFKKHHPGVLPEEGGEEEDSARHLRETSVIVTGGGSIKPKKPDGKGLPNFKTPIQPKDWFPPKKKEA